jgi:transposase
MYIARELVDMRKSFNTLADYVQFNLEQDPGTGDAFVFIGKRRNRLKVLIWSPTGYWLCCKRLEQGIFSKHLIPSSNENTVQLSPSQWHNILEGIVIVSSRKLKRYSDPDTG